MSSKTWTFTFETGTNCRADELIFQAIKDHVRGSEGFRVSVWDNQIMADYGVQFVWEENGERFEKPGTYFHHDACGEQEEEDEGVVPAEEGIQQEFNYDFSDDNESKNNKVKPNEFEWIEEALHSL